MRKRYWPPFDVVLLGIETSCDETAVAVLKDREVVEAVASQSDLHKRYGGIVPELASRRHIELICPLVRDLLKRAEVAPAALDAVSVTVGPGLVGALLVGVSFAKALSYALRIPLLPIHHLEGHISAAFLEDRLPDFPAMALVVSGGHTHLYKMKVMGEYQLLGKTRDDAAGEAFDKGARMLGLEYPGGPMMDRLAKKGDPKKFPFPLAQLPGLDFSFSGLKSALMRFLAQTADPKEWSPFSSDIAASYQEAIVESLVQKSILALQRENVENMILVGGVAANSRLRQRMQQEGERLGFKLFLPSPRYCTDNAAMIAMAGRFHFERRHFAPLDISPDPNLELGWRGDP